jgi:AcrR family transcriptional regulator
MTVPYEDSGRREQKSRTRQALVDATRRLLTDGVTPKVEDSAAEAGISRTTAYRYFPTQRALLLAAYPEIEKRTLLPADAPADPEQRLDLLIIALTKFNLDHEPQLRTALRLSLEDGAEKPLLRRGRAIGWIEDALEPLRDSGVDVPRLAVAIRAATGIEALVWTLDVARLSRHAATDLMRWTAKSLLRAAVADSPPPAPARRKGRAAR